MQPVNNRYAKNMRLTANKDITALFLTGKAFFVFPYRVVYNITKGLPNADTNLQMAPSVSKKKFKRAVKRNYIKRVTRETYRTKCTTLKIICNQKELQLHTLINYTHIEVLSFAEIDKAMQKIIEQLHLHLVNINLPS